MWFRPVQSRDENTLGQLESRLAHISRALRKHDDLQTRSSIPSKGNERERRGVAPANMLPAVVTTASPQATRAAARVGLPTSAAPAASSPSIASSGVSQAVQSMPAASTSALAATSAAAVASSAASQTLLSLQQTASASGSSAPLRPTPSSSPLSIAPSSSAAAQSTSSAAQANTASPSHSSLAHNTPMMIIIIVGALVGFATVLFGLTWLCRRSNTRKRSRRMAMQGNWSPGAGSSQFSFAHVESPETPGQLLASKETFDIVTAAGLQGQSRSSQAMPAPHQMSTPMMHHTVVTGALPNPNGRGWALFDQVAPSTAAQAPPADGPTDRPSGEAGPPRRPTFVQKAIAQPSRGSTVDVDARLSQSERSAPPSSASDRSAGCQSPGRPGSVPSGGLLSAFASSFQQVPTSTGGGKDRYLSWPAKSFRRKSTNVPIDSDFEGTIGAPDREVPRAVRLKNGERFACEATSSSSAGEESDYSPRLPVHKQNLMQPKFGSGMLIFEGGATPRTPGLAGVGAAWARASAQMSRFPVLGGHNESSAAPAQVTAPGRQLLGAPGLPPRFAHRRAAGAGSLADLKRHQAIVDDADKRQRASIPRDDDNASLTNKVASWWSGSWDAEWPSPTVSAVQTRTCDLALSPRTLTVPALAPAAVEMTSSPLSSPISMSSELSRGKTSEAPSRLAMSNPYMLGAQDSLRRSTSLRPKFAAATTLQSWLAPEGPQGWRSRDLSVPEEGSEHSSQAPEDEELYQGSLKSPFVRRMGSCSDFVVASDDEEFPLRKKGSNSSLDSAEILDAVEKQAAPASEVSLPSYHTDDGVSSHALLGHGETLIPVPPAAHEGKVSPARVTQRPVSSATGLRPLVMHQDGPNAVNTHTWNPEVTFRYLSSRQEIEQRAREHLRKERKDSRARRELNSVAALLGASPTSYVDTDGYTVQKVGVNMAVQPTTTNYISKKSLEGESSDVSDYHEDKLPCSNYEDLAFATESPIVDVSTAPQVRQALFTPASGARYQHDAHEAIRAMRSHADNCASGPLPSGVRCLDKASGRRKALTHHQTQQRRVVSTGSRPPGRLAEQLPGSESPSSSSDSDISVRRWGRNSSFYFSSSSESTSRDSTASGPLADWNRSKRRRAGNHVSNRVVSLGVVGV
ncbi:unnamed protein product [Parajaminaea phylloscopi]